jgi:hypothetical protein
VVRIVAVRCREDTNTTSVDVDACPVTGFERDRFGREGQDVGAVLRDKNRPFGRAVRCPEPQVTLTGPRLTAHDDSGMIPTRQRPGLQPADPALRNTGLESIEGQQVRHRGTITRGRPTCRRARGSCWRLLVHPRIGPVGFGRLQERHQDKQCQGYDWAKSHRPSGRARRHPSRNPRTVGGRLKY